MRMSALSVVEQCAIPTAQLSDIQFLYRKNIPGKVSKIFLWSICKNANNYAQQKSKELWEKNGAAFACNILKCDGVGENITI